MWVLILSQIGAALLYLRQDRVEDRRLAWLLKPLPVGICLAAALAFGPPLTLATAFLLAALTLSMAGDILLLDKKRFFVPGLVTFLAAHVAYILFFSSGTSFTFWQLPLLLPLIPLGIWVVARLDDLPNRLRIPIVLYAVILVAMVWRAFATAGLDRLIFEARIPDAGALLLAAGVLSFLVSDIVLAMNLFRRNFDLTNTTVLATYYLAQLLIVLGVIVGSGPA